MAIPTRIADRLASGIKRFQPVITSAKARDVNESDTVMIVSDILGEVFGYDKYSELTSEVAIRGTYCDLAIKLEGKIRILLETKAIGSDLKDPHIKQAIDYAANQGVEWVVLTNAVQWRIYRVLFAQPISHDLVIEMDFLGINQKNTDHLDSLYLLTKEGLTRSVLEDYHQQRQAMNRFFLGAMILTDPVMEVVRRELRRVSPGVKIDIEEIRTVLTEEVLKRDVTEGDRADDARRKISRSQARSQRAKTSKDATTETAPAVASVPLSPPLCIPATQVGAPEVRPNA